MHWGLELLERELQLSDTLFRTREEHILALCFRCLPFPCNPFCQCPKLLQKHFKIQLRCLKNNSQVAVSLLFSLDNILPGGRSDFSLSQAPEPGTSVINCVVLNL